MWILGLLLLSTVQVVMLRHLLKHRILTRRVAGLTGALLGAFTATLLIYSVAWLSAQVGIEPSTAGAAADGRHAVSGLIGWVLLTALVCGALAAALTRPHHQAGLLDRKAAPTAGEPAAEPDADPATEPVSE